MSLNKVALVGRLVATPELRATSTGVPVCSFRIALDRRPSQDGQKLADFVTCTAWRHDAEFVAKYFTQGKMICVDGSLRSDVYTDKDGVKRSSLEVLVDSLSFAG